MKRRMTWQGVFSRICLLAMLCASANAFGQAQTQTQAQTPLQDEDVAPATDPLIKADGEGVFRHVCQGCHMPDAKGAIGAGTYPALAGNPRLVSAAYMAAVILNGRRDMPAFGMKSTDQHSSFGMNLTDAQIAAVINYVRTHFGNHYSDTISAQQVATMHP